MATFSVEEQCVNICFLKLSGITPTEIHHQLSETCNGDVMDMKNVHLWVPIRPNIVWKWTETVPVTNQLDRHDYTSGANGYGWALIRCERYTAKVGISIEYVHTILHEDLHNAECVFTMDDTNADWWPQGCMGDNLSGDINTWWYEWCFLLIGCHNRWDIDASSMSILKWNGRWHNGSTLTHCHWWNFGLP